MTQATTTLTRTETLTTLESLDRAASHFDAFPVQLPPNLVGPIDLQIGLPDAFNLGHQHLIAPHPFATLFGMTLQDKVTSVTGWGDLQLPTDRLDPEGVTVPVDKRSQDLNLRSSAP